MWKGQFEEFIFTKRKLVVQKKKTRKWRSRKMSSRREWSRKKKDQTFQHFLKEEDEKRRRSFQKEQNYVVVRMKGLFENIAFTEEDSKTLENVLRTWWDMVKKAGKDVCQKQIREKRR